MKYIQSDYSGNHDELILCPIGDIHIGSPHFDERELKQHLDFIRENKERCRIILMGDLLETATKDSVGAGWAETKKMDEEDKRGILNQHVMKAKNYFWEFRDIIDGVIEGNHEARVYKSSGFQLMDMFCEMMQIPDKYLMYQGIIKYSINGRAYNVNIFHGAGGGRMTGSSVNRLEKQTETVLCDIYLMGHTHRQHASSRTVYVPNEQSMSLQRVTQYFVNTGHALDFDGSYAEQSGLPPTVKGFPLIYLNGKREGNIRTKRVKVVV